MSSFSGIYPGADDAAVDRAAVEADKARHPKHWENPHDIFPDHTDPEWALGSVLAQVEDLEPHERISVLEDALREVRGWHQPYAASPSNSHTHTLTGRYGIRYYDRAPALLPDDVEVEVKYGEDRSAKVQCEFDLKAQAEVAYRKLKDRVTGPIALYLITDNDGWVRLYSEDVVEDKVSL